MNDRTYLVLSDSHGRTDAVAEAIRRTRPAGIIFAGDGISDLSNATVACSCPIWMVRGNGDIFANTVLINGRFEDPDEEELFSIDGVRILLMHGHRFGVKHGMRAAMVRAATKGADILIFGHTHIPVEQRITPESSAPEFSDGIPLTKPLIMFNPGSIGDARPLSFGTLTIRGGIPLLGHGTL